MNRLLQIICWVRGYHISAIGVQKYDQNTGEVISAIGPCFLCRQVPTAGRVPHSSTLLQWKAGKPTE